ncbi:unnamed protein product [Urochloa decumbens]|uniref:Ethylene insensitive 3-like DNA-binding domain-containing protein n=1 Tax=Urochloa decumbens TaxID=240449 RepID=A0ABC9H155_9POAL
MAGQSSNLRASSSIRRARKLSEIGRDLDAAAGVEEAKRQRRRHSQPSPTAHPNAAAPVPPPLHYVAAFPMAGGVNGAALRWSTAATLGAAALPLPLPPASIAGGVNVPAGATAGPFVLAAAAPVQVQLVAAAAAAAETPAPAAVVGLPLAAALDRMKSDTLGRMLSALMPLCDPPAALQQRQSWAGPPPPWWPSATAAWWASDVAAHLHTIPVHTPVPYAPAYKLKKVQKVAALVAVVKHLSPDFERIARKVRDHARLTVQEENLWKNALANEAARRKAVPPAVFSSVILQQQTAAAEAPPVLAPASRAAAAENAVDGGEQQDVDDLARALVAVPAGDGGGQVAAVGEPEQEEGRDGDDGVLYGGAMAGGDDGGEQPGSATAAGGFDQLLEDMLAPYPQVQQVQEVHQVVDTEAPGAEEMAEVASEAPGAEEAGLEAPGAEEVAPGEAPGAGEAAEAAPEGRPWYMEGGMSSIFDDFEMPVGGAPHSYY